MKIVMQTNKTVEAAFSEFIFTKQNENLAQASISDYSNMFGFFMDFYGRDNPTSGINHEVYQRYLAYLRTKPKKQNNPEKKDVIEYLSDQSIATYARQVRTVLNFFMERGYLGYFKIILPKAEEKVKETYTQREMERLLEKPDLKTCRFSEYRNWVILNYITATANRISTVINLRIYDLDFEDETITLRTVKNKKQYVMPMSKHLKRILIEYLSYRKGELDDFLFCSENDSKKPLTEGGIKTTMAKYNQSRGVSKTSCHIIRHYFSLKYLQKRWAANGPEVHSWTQNPCNGAEIC